MPKKEPNPARFERTVQRLNDILTKYDRDFPPDPNAIDFYNMSDEELAAHAAARAPESADINAPLPWEDGSGEGSVGAHRDAPGAGNVGAHGVRPADAVEEGPGTTPEKPKIPKRTSPVANKQGQGGGPKTKEGQVIASRNSLKHGIMSNAPVVDEFETMEAWELHLAGINESINPQGPLEKNLAYRLAGVLWRLNRVPRHETASIKLDIAEVRRRWEENEEAKVELGEPPGDPAELQAEIDFAALPNDETAGKVIKYETFLHRESLQLIHELEAFQARRNGERTPLARLDISAPPS